MSTVRILFLSLLLLAAGASPALAQQTGAQEWLGNYRDAYQALIRFEKYGKPKHLIQQHLHIYTPDRPHPYDGLRLTLESKSLNVELPIDAAGRAVFPFQKAAYDENAALMLNRKTGTYTVRQRISLVPRADGIYEVAELRAACEQALGFLRYTSDTLYRNWKCAGVRFSYVKGGAEPVVQLRSDRGLRTLPVADGGAYWNDNGASYRTVTVKFTDLPDKGQVITQTVPLVVAPILE
ncbi:MAG TPA: hypothetical protein VIT92_16350 [Burkholderiaceae bacterium]